ncbi:MULTISPECIES: CopG family transcriptional regulator [Gemella]|uniref:CopG family transcriptional regulator n=1 Tax=Gemella TaxID=1378 RepID=UPI0009300B98|nr:MULTISPECIES: CopG family transcriptional regulator [Gemella]AXI27248.1 CopG family transcriptional regulator [Gemella sp. ND 6198]
MGAKVGRPKVDNPINIRTSVRLDKITDKKLMEYCQKNNISKGEAVRKGVHLLLGQQKKD